MRHIVAHKLREKAAGRDGDAIVVVDPHADLVSDLLEQVPESLASEVRLIDLADERGAVGINLLDTRIFADPRPDRRLGRPRRPRAVGAVGSADAVDPGADGQDPARGQRASGDRGARAVHNPRHPAAAHTQRIPGRRAQESARPLPARMGGRATSAAGAPSTRPRRWPRSRPG